MKNNINLRGTLHVTDWLDGIHYAPEETEIVQVLFKNTRAAFFTNPDKIPLKKGDWVAVEAAPGHDIGKVMLTGPLVRLQMKKSGDRKDVEMKRIFRKASESDIEKFEEARAKEHSTMIRSRQIAADLGLNMKIGDVEYQGDGGKAIFYYIADERVDFRKLIRILADTFKIRIEMKQIGARQEAGRIGGIGPCGRPLCCSTWMSRFVSVGTGAARIQDLSMNPQKLAGQCGKLKCCLNFETDVYAEASRQLPPRDAVLYTQDAEYYQFKTDILTQTITYSTDKHLAANLVTISAARALEIIELNKQGVKVEQLDIEVKEEAPKKEYVELVGQDSLTRFDKSKSKKRNSKTKQAETPAKKNQRKNPNDSHHPSRDNQKENKDEKRREKSNADKQNAPRQNDKQNAPKQNDKHNGAKHPKQSSGKANDNNRNDRKRQNEGRKKGNQQASQQSAQQAPQQSQKENPNQQPQRRPRPAQKQNPNKK
ncbi:MAG: hypothetical protein K2M88_09285 [Muribaculaceae bacterium]|nr:hypothetical protein [Muribaculaceae bacterium]